MESASQIRPHSSASIYTVNPDPFRNVTPDEERVHMFWNDWLCEPQFYQVIIRSFINQFCCFVTFIQYDPYYILLSGLSSLYAWKIGCQPFNDIHPNIPPGISFQN